MPITIPAALPTNDTRAFQYLARLGTSANLPNEVRAVFGKAPGAPVPGLHIATQFRTSPPIAGNALDVTWFGFRAPPRRRLPQVYACELDPALLGATEINLYTIGAVGNRHDVDILVTSVAGAVVQMGVYERLGFGGNLTKVGWTGLGFYEARRAEWIPSSADCRNKMMLHFANPIGTGGVAPSPCILWVVSYLHETGKARPGSIQAIAGGGGAGVSPNLHQDDDGSPGDGDPGGDGE